MPVRGHEIPARCCRVHDVDHGGTGLDAFDRDGIARRLALCRAAVGAVRGRRVGDDQPVDGRAVQEVRG